MRPKLIVFRTDGIKNHELGKNTQFAVIDLDSHEYPENFICNLPRNLTYSNQCAPSQFIRIFGNKSRDIAVELLTQALSKEVDQEIVSDLEKHLVNLEPKKLIEKKCVVCSKTFNPRRKSGNFEAKICGICMSKNR